MRSDMRKLLVEAPRWGHSLRGKKTGKRLQPSEYAEDADTGPQRAPARRHEKALEENLAPLRRYLEGQVGRPWDKVYSEIRQNLDNRSATGFHILQHLEDFVQIRTVLIDGKLYGGRWWGLWPVHGLYVHPITGLLRRAKPERKVERRSGPDYVRVDDSLAYQKLNGIWFRLEYGKAGEKVVLEQKRQCDAKTIRRIESGDFGELTKYGDLRRFSR
jgi:hypothetical protein